MMIARPSLASLRLTLSSFAAVGALGTAALGTAALAQEAPPVASPVPSPSITPLGTIAPPAKPNPEGEAETGEGSETPAAAATPAPPAAPVVVPIPAVWAPVPRDAEDRTAYGLYLTGRYLSGHPDGAEAGDGAQGAAWLAEVNALVPEQPTVREQAFTTALLLGDLNTAARLAPTGADVSPAIGEAGRLVTAVQTFLKGDARAAIAPIKASPIRPPHALAALLIQPWIAAAAGDWDLALIEPAAGATDQFSQVMRFQRAQLLEIRRRKDEAEAGYKPLATAAGAQPALVLGYGEFLERQNRRDEAVALYDAALAAQPGNGAITAAKARASSRGRAPRLPTWRQGVGRGLLLAASLASADRAYEFAALYSRLALNVTPGDDVRIQVAGTLTRLRLNAAARDALAEVGPKDPAAYAVARLLTAQSLAADDQDEAALAELQKAAAASPQSPEIAYSLAAQLTKLSRNEEALAILNGPLLAANPSAEVRFMRGAAYEATGKATEAETELTAALAAQPDQPAFLNFLGYLWVDNGTKVAEGAALIERAHAAEPNDGNIQDSLGWAQYRQGQYETAVATLEEAVAKEPANAEINDHLGDAYWQVGRKREAGWQWSRVLTLDPDAQRRAEVETKIASGLTPPTPVGGGDL